MIRRQYRYERYLSLTKLRKDLKRAKGRCTWCNQPASRRWCSQTCRDEGYLRAGFIEGPVEKRDKGVCALCGVDTWAINRRVKRIYERSKGHWNNDFTARKTRPFTYARIRRFARQTGYYPNARPYEIDHIVPVCEGGGCCGLDNLRTVCFDCHRHETAKLRKRLAVVRKTKNKSRPMTN